MQSVSYKNSCYCCSELLETIVTVSFLSLLTLHYMNAVGKLQELLLLLFWTALNYNDGFFPFIADCTQHEYSM